MFLRRSCLLCLLILSLVGALGCSEPEAAQTHEGQTAVAAAPAEQEGYWEVAEVKAKLDADEEIFLLDVRRTEELEADGLIEGAVHIPLAELPDRLAEIPREHPIVTYCQAGRRAGSAAKILNEAGHAGVRFGGLRDWKKAGYPVVYPTPTQEAGTEGSGKATE